MQDNISVTNQRVQFLWRKQFCGINLGTLEEAFDLDDLQVCVLSQCDCLHVTLWWDRPGPVFPQQVSFHSPR